MKDNLVTKLYVGTKAVLAWEQEKDGKPGYGVQYPNDGYVSWSPKDVFEAAYRESGRMSFSHALQVLKDGKRIARSGWNGKNMFIVIMPALALPPYNTQGTERKVNDRTAKWIGEDQPLDCQPYIAMYNAQKQWQPGWLASQADMLAEDWGIVE